MSAAMTFDVDPLTEVYNALVDVIRKSPHVQKHVEAGNIVSFGDERSSAKRSNLAKVDADMPELTIAPSGGIHEMRVTNKSAMHVERYNVFIRTGSRVAPEQMYPVRFALYRAIAAIDNFGLDYVMAIGSEPIEFESEPPGNNEDDGPEGWQGLMAINVQMHLDRKSMAAEAV
ncbi:MAG: hypothetical protein AAF432_00420 [Planctomycetota bacterium]